MGTVNRWATIIEVVGMCLVISIGGCSREEAREPNKPSVPKIPGGPGDKKPAGTPSGARPPRTTTQPLIKTPVSTQPSTLPAPLGISVSVGKPPSPPIVAPTTPGETPAAPAAAEDAPDASPFLPKTGVPPQWVKQEAIRSAPGGELDKLLPPDIVKIIEPYQTKRAFTCAYRLATPGRTEVAKVLLIETHQPEDAYGIYSVRGTGTVASDVGAQVATDASGARITMNVWKGRHYLQLECPSAGDPSVLDACKVLMRKIAFQMPDASPPELVEALPRPGLNTDQQWLIRGWNSLAGPKAAGLGLANEKQIGELIGLGKDTQMVIGTYKVKGATRPHVVWVVRYENPDDARKAYDRYQSFIDKASDTRSGSTMLFRPEGRYLLGTWTAEEESIEPVLPKLRSNLG